MAPNVAQYQFFTARNFFFSTQRVCRASGPEIKSRWLSGREASCPRPWTATSPPPEDPEVLENKGLLRARSKARESTSTAPEVPTRGTRGFAGAAGRR